MENLEARILRYPDLAPQEQEALAGAVEDRPALAALLEEVEALDEALGDAAALHEEAAGQFSEEALAHYLATPPSSERPPVLASAFEAIEAALREAEDGSALHARCETLARRLHTISAESTDPAAHFEALTGHAAFPTDTDATDTDATDTDATDTDATDTDATDTDATDTDATDASRVSEPARVSAPGATHRRSQKAPDRAEQQRGGRPPFVRRWGRYAAAAVLAVAVLYGALYAVSELSQSQTERLALIDGERLSVEGYGMRGMRTRGPATPNSTAADSAASAAADLDRRYLRALRRLRAARTSTLGLFPRYDAAELREATRALEAVARDAEAQSFVQLEALFFLGKARLAQGDRAGATQALRRVVAGDGRLAPEAQDILAQLYEDAAYDGPPAGE